MASPARLWGRPPPASPRLEDVLWEGWVNVNGTTDGESAQWSTCSCTSRNWRRVWGVLTLDRFSFHKKERRRVESGEAVRCCRMESEGRPRVWHCVENYPLWWVDLSGAVYHHESRRRDPHPHRCRRSSTSTGDGGLPPVDGAVSVTECCCCLDQLLIVTRRDLLGCINWIVNRLGRKIFSMFGVQVGDGVCDSLSHRSSNLPRYPTRTTWVNSSPIPVDVTDNQNETAPPTTDPDSPMAPPTSSFSYGTGRATDLKSRSQKRDPALPCLQHYRSKLLSRGSLETTIVEFESSSTRKYVGFLLEAAGLKTRGSFDSRVTILNALLFRLLLALERREKFSCAGDSTVGATSNCSSRTCCASTACPASSETTSTTSSSTHVTGRQPLVTTRKNSGKPPNEGSVLSRTEDDSAPERWKAILKQSNISLPSQPIAEIVAHGLGHCAQPGGRTGRGSSRPSVLDTCGVRSPTTLTTSCREVRVPSLHLTPLPRATDGEGDVGEDENRAILPNDLGPSATAEATTRFKTKRPERVDCRACRLRRSELLFAADKTGSALRHLFGLRAKSNKSLQAEAPYLVTGVEALWGDGMVYSPSAPAEDSGAERVDTTRDDRHAACADGPWHAWKDLIRSHPHISLNQFLHSRSRTFPFYSQLQVSLATDVMPEFFAETTTRRAPSASSSGRRHRSTGVINRDPEVSSLDTKPDAASVTPTCSGDELGVTVSYAVFAYYRANLQSYYTTDVMPPSSQTRTRRPAGGRDVDTAAHKSRFYIPDASRRDCRTAERNTGRGALPVKNSAQGSPAGHDVYLSGGAVPQLDCVFCLSRFTPSDAVAYFPLCRHLFHFECLHEWVEYQHLQTNRKSYEHLRVQWLRGGLSSASPTRIYEQRHWTLPSRSPTHGHPPHLTDRQSPVSFRNGGDGTIETLDDDEGGDVVVVPNFAENLTTNTIPLGVPGSVSQNWLYGVNHYPRECLKANSFSLKAFKIRCPLCQTTFLS